MTCTHCGKKIKKIMEYCPSMSMTSEITISGNVADIDNTEYENTGGSSYECWECDGFLTSEQVEELRKMF